MAQGLPIMCMSMAMGCKKVCISSGVLPKAESLAEPTAAEAKVHIVFKSLNRVEPASSVTLL